MILQSVLMPHALVQIWLMMHWLVLRFKRLKRITEQQSAKTRPVTEPPVIHIDLLPLMRGAWLVCPLLTSVICITDVV